MSLFDNLYKPGPTLTAVAENEQPPEQALPQDVQDYANETASNLDEPPTKPITKGSDWEAVNDKEYSKLTQEEEQFFKNEIEAAAMAGKTPEEVSGVIKGIASFMASEKAVKPHAAAISAERNRLSTADIDNLYSEDPDRSNQIHNQLVNEKNAVLFSAINALKADAAKGGLISGAWHFTKNLIPGMRAYKYGKYRGAIGDTRSFTNLFSTTERLREFRNEIGKLILSDTVNTTDFAVTVKGLVDGLKEEGLTDRDIRDLFESLENFDPGAETFYDTLDYGFAAYGAGKVAKGMAAYSKLGAIERGLIERGLPEEAVKMKLASKTSKAAKVIASGAEDVVGIPLVGDVVQYSARKVKKLVDAGESVYKNIPYIQAMKEKNRLAAADAVLESMGEPTETGRVISASKKAKDAQTFYEYGVDTALHPRGKPFEGVTNAVKVVAEKIQKTYDAVLDRAIKQKSAVRELKREVFAKFAKNMSDSLDIDNLLGAGRGVGTSELMSAFDADRVIERKSGDLTVLLRLQNPKGSEKFLGKDSVQKAYSRISQAAEKAGKDVEDAGKLAAEDKARKIQEAADAMSLKDYKVKATVEKTNGQWFVNLEIDTNKGWGTIYYDALAKDPKAIEKWRAKLSGIFTGSSNPQDIQNLNILRNIDASIYRGTGEAAKISYKALDKTDKALVQALVDLSTRYSAWYTPEHLLARGVSEKAVRAYENIRVMNDFDDFVRNQYVRDELVSKGAKSISYNGQAIRGGARIVPASSETEFINTIRGTNGKPGRDLLINRVFVDDELPIANAKLSDEVLADYYRKGYKIVEGSLSPTEGLGARTFYYLLDSDSLVVNDLGAFVTDYVAGGRRFFDRNSGFIKQLRIDKAASGRDAILGMRTFFADIDKVGTSRLAAKLEDIRSSIIRGDLTRANQIIQDAKWTKAPFNDAETFKSYFEELGMDFERLDNPLTSVVNGETLPSYDLLKSSGKADDFVGFDDMQYLARNSHFQALSNEAKQARKMRTGRELLTWDFESAMPVDFEKQVQYLVNDMVFNGVMHNFTDFYAERFSKLYRGVVSYPGGIDPTPRELLMNGQILRNVEGARGDLARSAEAAMKNYAAIRGVPTMTDQAIAKNGKALLDWVGGLAEKVLPISEEASHNVRVFWEKVLEKDPLGMSRTFASHWYLGMFNITQLYKQAASDVAIMLLEPGASAKALKYSMPFTAALYKSDGNLMKALDVLAKDFGDKPEAVRQNLKNLIDMGAFEHGVAGGFLERGQTVKGTLSKLSMMPFNIGEMQNRTTAYLTALIAKGFDGKAMSKMELAEVAKYGQALFLNMDAAGLSRIQTGTIGKTLLQFFGFRMKWLETVLFEKSLTKAQRTRLALGTSLLVGSEGMLGVTASSWLTTNIYSLFTNYEEPPETERSEFARFFQRGLLNYISENYGPNVDFAAPLSLEYGDMLDSIAGIATLDIASTQAATRGLQALKDMGAVIYDSLFGDATIDDFGNTLEILAQQGKLPSSVRPFLGYLLWHTGRDFNTKGELTERSNSMLRAVLHGLGFNSLEKKDIAKAWVEWSHEDGLAKELEKDYYEAVMKAMSTDSPYDWSVANSIFKMAKLPARVKHKILMKVNDKAYMNKKTTIFERMLRKQLEGFGGSNLIQIK